MSEYALDRQNETAPFPATDSGQIEDINEAWVMAYAEKGPRDEFLALRVLGQSSLGRAFDLGMEAANAAHNAQQVYRANLQTPAQPEEEPHTLVTASDLYVFARDNEYAPTIATQALVSLMRKRVRWSLPTNVEASLRQLRETAAASNGKLDIDAAREVLASIVGKGEGYVRVKNNVAIERLGPNIMSFMAHFINETLGLDNEARIPLLET